MPLTELSAALIAVGSNVVIPFVEKVLEKVTQRPSNYVDKELAAVFTRAYEYLSATGHDAQSVEPKLLKPIVENAPYETDPVLADLWAALLANAADILSEVEVIPAYAEILRQLTAPEAKLLAMFFAEITSVFRPYVQGELSEHFRQPAMRKAWALDRKIDVDHIYYISKRERRSGANIEELEERQRFQAMIDNLLRQRVIVASKEEPLKAGQAFEPKPEGVRKAYMTSLGYDFMLAVTPPTP